MLLLDKPLLLHLKLSYLSHLLLFQLLGMSLLEIEHVLGRSYLLSYIPLRLLWIATIGKIHKLLATYAASIVICILPQYNTGMLVNRYSTMHHLAILNRMLLSIVEVFHILINVVFLANLGSEGISEVVVAVRAIWRLGLSIFVRCQYLMHCTSFLRLYSFVLIIELFTPLVEAIELEFAPIASGSLF